VPSLDLATIARLLRPYASVDEFHTELISKYIDLLLKWNARINLTAVREPAEIVTRHFGESLFAARHLLDPGSSSTVADLGSGAGFPGVPLALWAPQAKVTLIESNGKKSAFLNELIHQLGLQNAKVFNKRAEDYGEKPELVTMRAVEKFEGALPIAAGLLPPEGRLALMIGAGQGDRARTGLQSFSWSSPVSVPGGLSRVLLVGTKKAKVG
jgi:16S rRNA (guanine527-N7)-methyltransferase